MPHKESKPGWMSVTEVLNLSMPKDFLKYWYGKYGTQKCEQIKRESQEIGLEVHKRIEYFLTTGLIDDNQDRPQRMVNNFINAFVNSYEVRAVELEKTYENETLKLQGTIDGIIETKEGLFVSDWKTSNQLDEKSVPLQLAAYAFLSGKGIWNGVAVRIDKEKDKVEVYKYPDKEKKRQSLDRYLDVFLNCLEVARYVKYGIESGE